MATLDLWMTQITQQHSPALGGSDERYRLVVQSIGTAGSQVIAALRRLRPTTDAELAARLYRAPSILLANLDKEKGTQLCSVLEKTGLELQLLGPEEPFEPGKAEFEVAFAVKDLGQMLAVIEETMRVVGVDMETAKKMACASPAVLLGGISASTAAALKRRYEALGAELDISRTADALFDVVVEAEDSTMCSAVSALLKGAGASVSLASRQQLMATGLDAKTTERIWPDLSRTAAKVQVLNRDLQRFDVRLERGPNSQEMRDWLTQTVGIPERLVQRALQRAPLILRENVTGPEMLELLAGAKALGAHATGILLALQMFSLKLKPGGHRREAQGWVQAIAGQQAAGELLDNRHDTLRGPFTKLQARWLQFELRKHDIHSNIVERSPVISS